MKKILMTIAVVTLVLTVSVGAYAFYGHGNRGQGMQGSGWGIMNGFDSPRGGMMGGRGMMQNASNQGDNGTQTCVCGRGAGNLQNMQPGQNAPGQQNAVPQMMTEDKAKETAEAYVKEYLPGYSVGMVEKDNWRPLYSVTLANEGGAELQMLIHGFSGQVMHLVPKVVEQPAEEEVEQPAEEE